MIHWRSMTNSLELIASDGRRRDTAAVSSRSLRKKQFSKRGFPRERITGSIVIYSLGAFVKLMKSLIS